MVSNALKKMIIFSSLPVRQMVEGVIKDTAAVSGASESATIEHALVNALLPTHDAARWWVSRLYTEEGSLSEAYTAAFCHLAAGVDWHAAASNGRPLVVAFASTLSMAWPTLTGEETQLYHLRTQLDSICAMLPDSGTPSDGDKGLCRICLQQLRDDPKELYLTDLLGIILRSWDVLGNHTRTYRALADIARLAAPVLVDTPSTRIKYLSALRTVSAEWQQG